MTCKLITPFSKQDDATITFARHFKYMKGDCKRGIRQGGQPRQTAGACKSHATHSAHDEASKRSNNLCKAVDFSISSAKNTSVKRTRSKPIESTQRAITSNNEL